jgi:hypothetical protein
MWWQKRSRRVWLALGYALACDAVFAVSLVILFRS